MAENSGIEWTTHTFNPWRGCTKVSAGCAHCYAETLSGRNPKTLGVWGPNGTRVVASEAQWRLPLKWNKAAGERLRSHGCRQPDGTMGGITRPRVFCASLADVFEDWQGPMVDAAGNVLEERPECDDLLYAKARPLTMNDVRRRLFDLIDATPNLDWLLLTKRPQNIAAMLPPVTCTRCFGGPCDSLCPERGRTRHNLWLGTSVENQAAANERIPHLLRTPAAVRFLSVEPLLGLIDFVEVPVGMFGPLRPFGGTSDDTPRIDWVIIGGESGPGARPCNVEWVRSIVGQCKAAAVACFVKQLGASVHKRSIISGNPVEPLYPLTLRDRKGGDIDEWPFDLRIREFPRPEGVGAVEGQQ